MEPAIQKAREYISHQIDELISKQIFYSEQKNELLNLICNERLMREVSFDLSKTQSQSFETLSFKFLEIKRNGRASDLFKMVTNTGNDVKRVLVTNEDIIPRGMFDFSPLESY